MNGTGKTAAAAGSAGMASVLLIKLFAHYELTLSPAEAVAMATLIAPVLHGVVDVFSAAKSALIARIAPKGDLRADGD